MLIPLSVISIKAYWTAPTSIDGVKPNGKGVLDTHVVPALSAEDTAHINSFFWRLTLGTIEATDLVFLLTCSSGR